METEDNNIGESDMEINVDSSITEVENTELSINEEPQVPQQSESEPAHDSSVTGLLKENVSADKRRFLKLPITRVKSIMKADPDVHLVGQDAVFLVTKATELFLQYMGREAAAHARTSKRKTILKRDVDIVIENVPHLCFLEGTLE